jgi:hypothetical protein
MKKSYLLCIVIVFAVTAGLFYLQRNTFADNKPPILKGEEAKITYFVMGDVQFAVPVYYYEGLWRPENAPKSWIKENRMDEAKFRNIFDGRCYKECANGRKSYGEMNVSVSKTAQDAKIFNSENFPCENPEELAENSSYKTTGVPCHYAFMYQNLLVNVRFTTGDYPRQSIPEMERRLRAFLDRFVQPMPAKGE